MFRDRAEAGKVLARLLTRYTGEPDVVVLGVARDGIRVARQVADALGTTLGVIVARRIGLPGVEEVALGAIAEGSRRIVLHSAAQQIGVPASVIERLAANERVVLERCAALYHSAWPLPDLRGRVVLLVDDGLATGVTLRAAARAVRLSRPARLAAAVPVASVWGAQAVRREVDELTVVVTPDKFETVSEAYADYDPVTDDDVLEMLGRRSRRVSSIVRDVSDRVGMDRARGDDRPAAREQAVRIPVAGGILVADLGMPPRGLLSSNVQRVGAVRRLVILVAGAGSGRHSFANRYLAGRLRLAGYATLRLDVLTKAEQHTGSDRASIAFDVERLATRVAGVCDWAARHGVAGSRRTSLIGAGTGAAVALVTAHRHPESVSAVIGCAGRIELPAHVLSAIQASMLLLIVGAVDQAVGGRHENILRRLPPQAEVVKVSRASHSLDQPDVVGFAAERIVKWLDGL